MNTIRPPRLPDDFAKLSQEEQARIVRAADAMSRYVYRHATSVLIAGRPGGNARIRNGSGFILKQNGRRYLGTAWHVVESWQHRVSAGEDVQFQVGTAVLNPDPTRIWADPPNDIAFIPITEREMRAITVEPLDPVRGWPPPEPKVGDYVLISGFPGYLRRQYSANELEFLAVSTLLQVKAIGSGYAACQFERQHWIATNWNDVPPPGTDMGGISGAPVLLVQDLVYPLVGLASEFSRNYEILYFRTFGGVPAGLP